MVATIFTTDTVVPLGHKLMAAVDDFALQPITARVAWDFEGQDYEVAGAIEGEALESFFGTPLAPFEHNPGHWGSSRYNATASSDRASHAARTANGFKSPKVQRHVR